MLVRSCGYIFGCKQDCNGKTGLVEKYTVRFRGNHQCVSLLCTLDAMGKLVAPAYNDITNGFLPLRGKLEQGADIVTELTKFVRSNKATYSKFGEFSVIVEADLEFDMADGKFLEPASTISLYAPKSFKSDIMGLDYAVICDMISVKPGLNMMVVDLKLMEAYRMNFLSAMTMQGTQDKAAYLLGRVGRNAGGVV